MYAFTKSARGRLSTFRKVDTWNLPSNRGASRTQSELGFSARFLRKSPTPLSTNADPAGFGAYPNSSGLVSLKYGIFAFLGTPRLDEVKSVNSGALLPTSRGPIFPARLSVPSRWQVLHFALPRKRSHPACSSGVSTCWSALARA